MTNTKTALFLERDPINEEHVTLLIEGHVVECFVNSCPYSIEIGKSYSIDLSMYLSEACFVDRAFWRDSMIEKTGPGYGYFLYGTLNNEKFLSFTLLHDEDLHYEHPHLNDSFIKIEVQRLDVNFL